MPSYAGFVPTPPEQIDGFLDLIVLSESDLVYDLGSGDGRLLFAALQRGAGKAVGVELNDKLLQAALELARSKKVQDQVSFRQADVMEVNLRDASVVFCYLSLGAAAALKPKFAAELKPGTKIIMEMYPVPGWKPLKTICKDRKRFFLYTMPPQIETETTASDPLLDYLNSTPE